MFALCPEFAGVRRSFPASYPFELPTENAERVYAVSGAPAIDARHSVCEFTTTEYLRGFLEAIAAAQEPLHQL